MVNIADHSGGLLQLPASVDFGKVAFSSSRDRVLTVTNRSQTEVLVVQLNNPTPNPPFSLVSAAGELAVLSPGTNAKVTLRYAPGVISCHSGTLTFTSTDPSKRTGAVALKGCGK
jgi:Abnormal spindle-like microcephaly-assoc'd, ASPM-SPD-2-Hydin